MKYSRINWFGLRPMVARRVCYGNDSARSDESCGSTAPVQRKAMNAYSEAIDRDTTGIERSEDICRSSKERRVKMDWVVCECMSK